MPLTRSQHIRSLILVFDAPSTSDIVYPPLPSSQYTLSHHQAPHSLPCIACRLPSPPPHPMPLHTSTSAPTRRPVIAASLHQRAPLSPGTHTLIFHLSLPQAPCLCPGASPAPRIQHSRSPALPLHHLFVVPHLSQRTYQLTTHPCAPPLCPGAPSLPHGAPTLTRPKHTHPHCLCAAVLTLLFSARLAEFTTSAFPPSHMAQFSSHPVAAMPT